MNELDSNVALGLVAILFGGIIVVEQLIAVIRGLQARQWEQTKGSVIWSSVWRDLYSGDRHVFWAPVVRYEYTVRGVTYTGSRISFAKGVSNTMSGATRVAMKQLARGQSVTVWYDPTRPESAVLIPGVSFGFWLLLGAGVVLLWIGIAAFR